MLAWDPMKEASQLLSDMVIMGKGCCGEQCGLDDCGDGVDH